MVVAAPNRVSEKGGVIGDGLSMNAECGTHSAESLTRRGFQGGSACSRTRVESRGRLVRYFPVNDHKQESEGRTNEQRRGTANKGRQAPNRRKPESHPEAADE